MPTFHCKVFKILGINKEWINKWTNTSHNNDPYDLGVIITFYYYYLKFSRRLIEIFSKHFFLSNKNVNSGLRSFLFYAYFLKLTVLGKSGHFFPFTLL